MYDLAQIREIPGQTWQLTKYPWYGLCSSHHVVSKDTVFHFSPPTPLPPPSKKIKIPSLGSFLEKAVRFYAFLTFKRESMKSHYVKYIRMNIWLIRSELLPSLPHGHHSEVER